MATWSWNGKLGPAPINVILRARRHLKADQGFQADLRLTAGVFQAWGISAGLVGEATWADASSNRTIYGVTAQQAAISGLPAFAPGGGLLLHHPGGDLVLRPGHPLAAGGQPRSAPGARRRGPEPAGRTAVEHLCDPGCGLSILNPSATPRAGRGGGPEPARAPQSPAASLAYQV